MGVKMNVSQELERIRKKLLDRLDGMDDGGWKTINGTHVLIDEDGEMIGGPENLKKWNSARREASGKGKKKSKIDACKTADDLLDCIQKEMSFENIGYEFNEWVHTDGGFEVVSEIMRVAETQIFKEIPELKDFFFQIDIRHRAIMSTRRDGVLYINPKETPNLEAFKELCRTMSSQGWSPPNSTPGGTLAHECGHGVVDIIYQREKASGTTWEDVNTRIMNEAVKRYRKESKDRKIKINDCLALISEYATSRPTKGKRYGEAIADAFGYCYDNGEKAHPFAKILKETAIKQLREGNNGSDKGTD